MRIEADEHDCPRCNPYSSATELCNKCDQEMKEELKEGDMEPEYDETSSYTLDHVDDRYYMRVEAVSANGFKRIIYVPYSAQLEKNKNIVFNEPPVRNQVFEGTIWGISK